MRKPMNFLRNTEEEKSSSRNIWPTQELIPMSKIEVSSLKYPYKEFSWFFPYNWIGIHDLCAKNIVYILHFVVHEDALIDWGQLFQMKFHFNWVV
jgi:hypothetical protein